MVGVRPDKDNPRSEGYACRKGLNVAFHQHQAQRLTHPLKKEGDAFKEISWDQAIEEISEKLGTIVRDHGPRSFAYMGLHGFGLDYNGMVYGVNVNRLTKNTHRDKIAGTPLHRYVPCRVEAV